MLKYSNLTAQESFCFPVESNVINSYMAIIYIYIRGKSLSLSLRIIANLEIISLYVDACNSQSKVEKYVFHFTNKLQ